MDRTVFYAKETVVDQVTGVRQQELDYLHNSLNNFVMTYLPTYYRVADSDIYRADTISQRNYGTVGYWWIVLFINGIHDPFNDPQVGQQFTIPNVLDIYNFWKNFRVVASKPNVLLRPSGVSS